MTSVVLRLLVLLALPVAPLVAQENAFDRTVAPLLAGRCFECHTGSAAKGGLDLTRKATTFKGGESGVAVVPGKLQQSVLWERVSADEMPPKHPLNADEKRILKSWIESGAKWGSDPIDPFRFTTSKRAGYDWWSLQPLKSVNVPKVEGGAETRNEIDRFVLTRLRQTKLEASSPADPRTLLRRVYFDLIGLPPDYETMQKFVENPTDEAYATIVEGLLKSPRYGERWGRHWLDVVRFGESNGFERNAPRRNFWHYRDWVIDSLNNDMPYDEFVRMQLIGDLLKPGAEGTASVGFLVAGVHNTVVGGSERMKRIARQDELEEVIGAVGQTFLGLTVNCSRCHDHKFDPISQREYYQLISSISGLRHGERTVREAVSQDELNRLTQHLQEVSQELSGIEQRGREQIIANRKTGDAKPPTPPRPFAQWEFEGNLRDNIGTLHGTAHGSAKVENGALVVDGKSFVETTALPINVREKTLEAWVQLDTPNQKGGGAISLGTLNGVTFDAIVFAELETNRWMAGSNNFARTESFKAPEDKDAAQQPVHIALVYQADGTIIGYRNGKPYGKPIRKSGLQAYSKDQSQIIFGLRHKPPGGNRFLKAKIHKASLYDRALTPAEVAASSGNGTEYVSEAELVKAMPAEMQQRRKLLQEQLTELTQRRQQIESRANLKIYTLNPTNGEQIKLLPRGDAMADGPIVSPGGIAAVQGVKPDFGLPPNASDAQRRRRLAEWITHPENPLFTRTIVNRVWHYHFGAGLVETPNDLGFSGRQPSHPALLNWLAYTFREDGYRLKSLHRRIVLSRTYRQSSAYRKNAFAVDANNRLLWRMNPRRLEAEALRDAILQVSGQLNLQMHGPGYLDVRIYENKGTTYYDPLKVHKPETLRRTVYRFTPRGERSALLDTFDCPDPSVMAPRRAVTTTPLAALSLMNNSFVLQMADGFAERVKTEAGDDPVAQVNRAWQLALARNPSDDERRLSLQLVKENDLVSLCRALFNVTEFVRMD